MGAEGDLSFTPDSSSADFDYGGPLHSCYLYHHTHGPIFPIDPDVENASKTDRSDVVALSTSKPLRKVGAGISSMILMTHEMAMQLGRRAAILQDLSLTATQTPNFIMKTTDALQGTASDDALWTLHVFDDLTAEDSERRSSSLCFGTAYIMACTGFLDAEAQQNHDEAKCKARIDSDSRVRQVDAFDMLLPLQEMTAYNAVHNTPLSESQSAQKDNDDVR
ncbi:hypothetical protein EV421DRAFT_1733843 [Armillaria borealis]|uniref:Uncharacterized protein n=1 Tax=Armillaria borealis TaxID=47425 RepID=A0AA39JRR2_9AGAR|nr:hypothetical protein EV421DRAFT_1733843 [Armillaria borealis]